MAPEEFWQSLCILSCCLNGYLYYIYRTKSKTIAGEQRYMKDKIKTVMDEGERKGCINPSQKILVENVLDFKEKTAEDVMIHRRDVTMISLDTPSDEILEKIKTTGLSRYPVFDHNADDVVGILATRKFLLDLQCSPRKNMKELIYPAYFVPKTVSAEGLLRDMQARKTHISIVVDEYGGVDGIVTLEDLLEEIVGNIYDEFDPLAKQQIIPLGENLWQIDGSADLEEVAEAIGFPLPEEELEFDTIGGLVYDQLDVIPQDGTLPTIQHMGLQIKVDSMIGSRIQWVHLSLIEPSTSPS